MIHESERKRRETSAVMGGEAYLVVWKVDGRSVGVVGMHGKLGMSAVSACLRFMCEFEEVPAETKARATALADELTLLSGQTLSCVEYKNIAKAGGDA